MINNTYVILMLCLIIISGFLSSLSDFKYGKIYNRHVIVLFVLGIFIQFTWLVIFSSFMLLIYLSNLIIGTCLGYFLYYYNIWSAGDAKLYSLFLALVPVVIYPKNVSNIFPGFIILVLTFTVAFLYIALDTLYLFIKEMLSGVVANSVVPSFNTNTLFKMLPVSIFAYIFAMTYNDLLSRYAPTFYMYNIGILKFLNFVIIFILLSKNLSNMFYIIVSSCGIIYIFSRVTLLNPGGKFSINISTLVLVTAVILVRYIAARYNYKRVGCKELKPGSVLSYGTIVSFANSKVKGLPMVTTESPQSRLSMQEIESVIRWSRSKYGNDYVYVVRHMPFAPFITLGTFFYVLYNLIVH